MFPVPSDALYYGLASHVHQLNVSGVACKSDYIFYSNSPCVTVFPFDVCNVFAQNLQPFLNRVIKSLFLYNRNDNSKEVLVTISRAGQIGCNLCDILAQCLTKTLVQ